MIDKYSFFGVVVNLKSYLCEKGITQRAFSLKIGITQTYLSRIVLKRVIPAINLAKKIEKETDGEVTAIEILFP